MTKCLQKLLNQNKMNFKYVNQLKTKYNPSVIEYSSAHKVFICGTYELFDEQNKGSIDEKTQEILKRVNNRFGNLLLISINNQLLEEYECFDGGVFDLKLIKFNDKIDNLLVAHSNGFVAIYDIEDNNQLNCLKRYKTESSLLTCLTTIDNKHSVVGNSEGNIVLINLINEKWSQLSVTKCCEPIWTLFCYRFNDTYVLIVGSDDSLWRVYYLNDLSLQNLKPIYLNNDSNAGITSFASNYSLNNLLSLIVGSYDELIRFYEIEFLSNESKISVSLKHKIHIPESGIWRIIVKELSQTLLVSGMYSGAHLIVNSNVVQTLNNCIQTKPENQQKELIYGLNCDSLMDNILMASFYGQTIYLFRKEI
jgi:hypothetical protein